MTYSHIQYIESLPLCYQIVYLLIFAASGFILIFAFVFSNQSVPTRRRARKKCRVSKKQR